MSGSLEVTIGSRYARSYLRGLFDLSLNEFYNQDLTLLTFGKFAKYFVLPKFMFLLFFFPPGCKTLLFPSNITSNSLAIYYNFCFVEVTFG